MVLLSLRERARWWRGLSAGSPYVCAPMVLQSELAFRMMARKHGAGVCYSPMLPVKAFLACPASSPPGARILNAETGGPGTQDDYFTTCEGDRPVFAQLGGSDVDEVLAAALLVQDRVDAVDLNFGCPQRCAHRDGYGAFLMDDPQRARRLVETLARELRVPVTCKIRIFPDLEDTLAWARMLQDAGAAAIAVHGRRREQRHHEGLADWAAIKAVKATLQIPVIANGNVQARADADACLRETGVDAVMSATGLMENPRLFDTAGGVVDRSHESLEGRVSLAFEYLKHAAEYPDGCLPRMVSDHLLAILRPELARHPRLRKRIKDYAKNGSVPQQAELVLRVAASRRPL